MSPWCDYPSQQGALLSAFISEISASIRVKLFLSPLASIIALLANPTANAFPGRLVALISTIVSLHWQEYNEAQGLSHGEKAQKYP
jgi:hypothetical protein